MAEFARDVGVDVELGSRGGTGRTRGPVRTGLPIGARRSDVSAFSRFALGPGRADGRGRTACEDGGERYSERHRWVSVERSRLRWRVDRTPAPRCPGQKRWPNCSTVTRSSSTATRPCTRAGEPPRSPSGSFRLPPGAQKHVPSKTHWRELGAVREGEGWLGVDPMVNWELGVLGPVE